MAARAAAWLAWSAVVRPIASAGYGKKQANAKSQAARESQAARDHPRRAGGTARVSASIADILFINIYKTYLPEDWCATGPAAAGRRKAHIPEAVAFATKPQIAAGLIRQTVALGVVTLDWITADEEYGKNGAFLDEVERLELRYVVEVPVSTTVWTEDPASCVPPSGGRGRVPTRPSRAAVASVAAVASHLGREMWRTLEVRPGEKGPLTFEFAATRVWAVRHGAAGGPVWLVVRRSLDPEPEVNYFEEAKSYLGMAQYETRSWVGWHHHMSLVALAHLFITLTRRALGENAGADARPDGAVAPTGIRGPRVVAEAGGAPGGLPHPPQ